MELLQHPFVIGLGVGLIVAVVFWISGLMNRRGLVKELATLREHLQRQMEINQKGSDAQKKELEELRKQNENLRVTNSTLKGKPGRAEIQTLTVYDKALHIMNGRAPGFGPAWESAVKEAEMEVAQADSGIMPMLRKVFRPSLAAGGSPQAIEETSASEDSVNENAKDSKAKSGSF
jgi:hypothetical protein